MMRDFYNPGGIASHNGGMFHGVAVMHPYDKQATQQEYNPLLHESLRQQIYRSQSTEQENNRNTAPYITFTRAPRLSYTPTTSREPVIANRANQGYKHVQEELLENESSPQSIERIQAAFTKGPVHRKPQYARAHHDYSFTSASRRSAIEQKRARLLEHIVQKKQNAHATNRPAAMHPGTNFTILYNESKDTHGKY
ncbi:hypothetical protein HZB03_01750 [Candidatus Woesearchaeota archaeon]|nr:hypothetical protein [Candidatus Woesearchaeota archaeon]